VANKIDWQSFEQQFGASYSDQQGAPAKPLRLMVGLLYLKHAYSESDESVVARFLENPYWQYFCGYEYFQHELPVDPSSLSRFRRRTGAAGLEKLLEELLHTAKRENHLTARDLEHVNADTTVQEKAIAFPTDARLYHKMRVTLVRAAAHRGLKLRQSYRRVGKKLLAQQSRYAQAQQYKRARKATRQLKTYLGRVYRDLQRQAPTPDAELEHMLVLAERLFLQKQDDKNKLYSVHAPEVECIAKGKAHKRYEFGCKVSLVTTSKSNWIVGMQALHHNPYDGHTLPSALEQVERLTGIRPKAAYADMAYRGQSAVGDTTVHIVDRRRLKSLTRSVRRWFNRRAAIEPIFGHLKADHRMARNYLKGTEGDKTNALLCACGFTLRKLLRAFLFCLSQIIAWILQKHREPVAAA
jgi:IS5 family transposase